MDDGGQMNVPHQAFLILKIVSHNLTRSYIFSFIY
jgi:hypothetical protein